jgi:acyl-CoA thioesterase I
MKRRICVFGDSTAYGKWDPERGGWVGRLWLETAKRKGEDDYVSVFNLSISGGTTETILERFEKETEVRWANAFIFQTGGNDASYRGEIGKHKVDPETFKKNLEEIIKRARAITDEIIFVSIHNSDESKTMPVYWGDVYYVNEALQKYNAILKEVCEENNILFLDRGLLEMNELEDGIHPNSAGHEKIFQKVKQFLKDNKWI